MQVRLLGNLDVVTGDAEGFVPGAGERALLAFLALQAGHVVSADRLIDALWGEQLPANPANALQTRVSKLRRVVAALGLDERVVETVPPGYRLALPPEQVDALRFEREVAAARACALAGAANDARRRYAEALDAWRGPALADFPEALWAASEARRLEELRLSAVQERIQLDLDGGRHAEVVAELEALLGAHPLREGLCAQLMTALYRCGRQADALAAYQRARETLDTELGLDPSAELRELEAAILRQDPTLGAPSGQLAAPAPGGNLPARIASFIGRDEDAEEVAALLGTQRLVTITGPGGAGKTTLSLEVARRAAGGHHDGAWFVDLSGATEAGHVASVLTDALELPAIDARPGESREKRLARQLHGRRCLLVIDNCEQVVDAAADLIDQLLRGAPGVRVLATSRAALAVAGEVQYALAPLALDDAAELFMERARAVNRDFPGDAPARLRVAELCRQLDGMPLAIELAAARAKSLSLEEIEARLADRFRLLSGGPRTAQARHQTLRATVDWSYGLLAPPDRLLLQRLSVFRGRWSLEAAEEVCADEDLAADDVLELLDRLVDRSLVVAADGRFGLLETIRAYAAERLAGSGAEELVRRRHHLRLLRLAESCEPDLHGADQEHARRRLSAEIDDLRAALAWAASGGDLAFGQRLAGAVAWYWFLGDHEEGRDVLRGLAHADSGDPSAQARALQALSTLERPGACVVHPHGAAAEAAQRAAGHFAAAGDPRGEASCKILLAVQGVLGHDVARALARLDEAEAALEGEPWSLALCDFVRMEVLVRHGDPDEALAFGERAFGRFAGLGDPWGMSAVRAHQGHSLRFLGRYGDAVEACDEALTVARRAGLQNTVTGTAGEAGLSLLRLGETGRAHAAFQEAAECAARYGFLSGKALADLGEGWLAWLSGDGDEALMRFEAAIQAFGETGSPVYLAEAWVGLAAARAAADPEAAERACREVLRLSAVVPEPSLLAAGLEGLAMIRGVRGDHLEAAELLGAAEAERARGGRFPDPLTIAQIESASRAAKNALGAKAFGAALARGRRNGAARHREPVTG